MNTELRQLIPCHRVAHDNRRKELECIENSQIVIRETLLSE